MKAPLSCNAAFSMLHCSFSLAAAQLLVKMTSALQKNQCCSATSVNCSATSVFACGMLQGWGLGLADFFGLIPTPRYIRFYSEKRQIHWYWSNFFPPLHGLFRKKGGDWYWFYVFPSLNTCRKNSCGINFFVKHAGPVFALM